MNEKQSAKLLALVGLAQRAGKLAVGASAVQKLVRHRKRPVLIVARDMGATQRRRICRLAPIRGIVPDILTRQELARALGRKDVSVVAVADAGFVAGIEKLDLIEEPAEAEQQRKKDR